MGEKRQEQKKCGESKMSQLSWCVKKEMTLNAWLHNWQRCRHNLDTSRDIHSYLMISTSFNSIALTSVI